LDFVAYCRKKNIVIEKAAFVGRGKKVSVLPNVFALVGIFLLSNREDMKEK
jgi:hypothetical protein